MDSEIIHIHKQKDFGRLVIFMIPCVAFFVALFLYMLATSYTTQRAATNFDNSPFVLGTQK